MLVYASHLRVGLRPWLSLTFIFVFFVVSLRFKFLSFNFENPWKSQPSLGDKSSSKELSVEDSDFVVDINNLYQASEIEVSKSFIPFLQSSDKSDLRKEPCPVVSPKLGGVVLKLTIAFISFKLE
jgi:hypothetical protein